MIRIFGTMTDPSGSPVPGAIIELRAINSTSEVLLGSTVTHKCDQQGAYSFQLATGTYDAYAQNDRCGDLDYLGTAKVAANSVDGDLHSILVDGGINLTPPMLENALAAAQQAEVASVKTAEDRYQVGLHVVSSQEAARASTKHAESAKLSALKAIEAKESITADAAKVRGAALVVEADRIEVSSKQLLVQQKAKEVSDNTEKVSRLTDQVAGSARIVAEARSIVSDSREEVLTKTRLAMAAADTATQKAAQAAEHEAVAGDYAKRAENAAGAVTGAILDGGLCDLSGGKYPLPIKVAGKFVSTVWFVSIGGTIGEELFSMGDMLRYTTAEGGRYFRVDGRDDVYDVCGMKGSVKLNHRHIGAEKEGTAELLLNQHSAAPDPHSQYLTKEAAITHFEQRETAVSLVEEHSNSENVHQISSVTGLRTELDNKYSPDNKPTPDELGVLSIAGGRMTGDLLLVGGRVSCLGPERREQNLTLKGDKYAFLSSPADVHLCMNSYWNGRYWKKDDNSKPSAHIVIRANQVMPTLFWSDAGSDEPHQHGGSFYGQFNKPVRRWLLVWQGVWGLMGRVNFNMDMRNRLVMFEVSHLGGGSTVLAHTNDGTSQGNYWCYGTWEYFMKWIDSTTLEMANVFGHGASHIYRVWVEDYL